MGNPSPHASHLASQWLKNRVLLIYLNSFFLTHPKHISVPGPLVSVIWVLPGEHRHHYLCLTQYIQKDPRIQDLMVSVCSAPGGSDREQRHKPCSSSLSDLTGDTISTNQPKSHSSLSHSCPGKHNLGSSSQNSLQTLGQGCAPR